MDPKDHWNKVYKGSPINQLGWYESEPLSSLSLIERCSLDKQEAILDAGSGTSTLIPSLLELGYTNLTALDISREALQKARLELGEEKTRHVRWVVEDILNPSDDFDLKGIALWHDRAVFHFLTDEEQQEKYRQTMLGCLHLNSYVILSAFTHGSPSKCSGLPVKLHDKDSLKQFMGTEFQLMENFESVYCTPAGETRQYIHTLFLRKAFFSLSLGMISGS